MAKQYSNWDSLLGFDVIPSASNANKNFTELLFEKFGTVHRCSFSLQTLQVHTEKAGQFLKCFYFSIMCNL